MTKFRAQYFSRYDWFRVIHSVICKLGNYLSIRDGKRLILYDTEETYGPTIVGEGVSTSPLLRKRDGIAPSKTPARREINPYENRLRGAAH